MAGVPNDHFARRLQGFYSQPRLDCLVTGVVSGHYSVTCSSLVLFSMHYLLNFEWGIPTGQRPSYGVPYTFWYG